MNKLILSSAIILAMLGTADAKSEVQVTRTIYDLTDFPELAAKTKAVCGSKAVQSVKLQQACKDDKFPGITKAGAYRNVGIGAELNTLIRQAGGGDTTAAKPEAETK